MSFFSPNGSKLNRSFPENKTGSCGMIETFVLKSCNPNDPMSTPSIKI